MFNFLQRPLATAYRYAFHNGDTEIDVCAGLTDVGANHWHENPEVCEDMLVRRALSRLTQFFLGLALTRFAVWCLFGPKTFSSHSKK